MKSPALVSQPRSAPAPLVSVASDKSILTWLEQTGRLMDRDIPIDPSLLDDLNEVTAALVGEADMDDDFEYNSDEED
jgi:Protein of unknown function (DUF3134)